MKNPAFDPSQIRLPVFDDLYGQPARPVKYYARKLSRRREHPGAPALGIDYGFDFGENGERDQQGYETVKPTPVPVTADTFDRLRLDRNTQRYHRSLELARLIILNYSPDLQGGSNNVLAILFDMNKLFERFILVHLRRAQSEFKNGKLSITGQASERFWKSKTIRPDVVIDFHTLANAERIILDTKWKIPKDDQPSDDDLKQMYVYNLQFGARRSFLVYPRSDVKQKETFAAYEKSDSDSPNHRHSCGTHFVDLFDANLDLRKDIGKQLLEQIINTAEQVGAN